MKKWIAKAPPRIGSSPADAIRRGFFNQVRYLLDLGHSPNTPLPDWLGGRSALILCAFIKEEAQRVSLARILLEKGAHIDQCDIQGLNAVHYACLIPCPDLVDVYLKAIDFDINQPDLRGNTALHYVVQRGNVSLLSKVLSALRRYGMSVDPVNKDGLTPLMQAWECGQFECAKRLLDAGASRTVIGKGGRSVDSYEAEALEKYREELEIKSGKPGNLRFNDVIGWRRRQERLRSAPSGERKQKVDDFPNLRLTSSRKKTMTKVGVITEAPSFDIRNDPLAMFHVNPINFFNEQNRTQRQRSLSRPSTTAAPSLTELDQRSGTKTWKRLLGPIYYNLTFQYSPSYRIGVIRSPILMGDSGTLLERDLHEKTQRSARRGSSMSFKSMKGGKGRSSDRGPDSGSRRRGDGQSKSGKRHTLSVKALQE